MGFKRLHMPSGEPKGKIQKNLRGVSTGFSKFQRSFLELAVLREFQNYFRGI